MVGFAIVAIVGYITLILRFVAFPLAASLLQNGAWYAQITMFVTSLMMVGIAFLMEKFTKNEEIEKFYENSKSI